MTFATDFLLRAKEGVQNTAVALTESVSPDVRALLRSQLQQGIMLHQEITDLMIRKKWFHPYDLQKQYQLDQLSADDCSGMSGKMSPLESLAAGLKLHGGAMGGFVIASQAVRKGGIPIWSMPCTKR
ncbi:spore coat protein [Paenibacillus sp. LC-T2]|uniref:Spore coat protein n=1 Tax=Paenibacillus monticola TaxID=2666075 RepID=A0A7X2H7M2_9BACL|nr:spore coat protein [Paenibacillus monticola]